MNWVEIGWKFSKIHIISSVHLKTIRVWHKLAHNVIKDSVSIVKRIANVFAFVARPQHLRFIVMPLTYISINYNDNNKRNFVLAFSI